MIVARRVAAAIAVAASLGAAACSAPAPPQQAPAPGAASGEHHHAAAAPGTATAHGQPRGRLVVHADHQLRPVLDRLAASFEEAFPHTDVLVEYGAGHARHLAGGAAVDVLVTGDPAATAGAAAHGASVTVARDPLVLATARTTTGTTAADLLRPGVRVALCATGTSCGDAARLGTGRHRVTVRADGRGAVAAVVTGAADVALVHRTDVVAAGADLRVVDFREGLEHADRYVLTVAAHSRNPVTADAFRALMTSALATRVFSDAGFTAA
ncbi:molybdate ABC transporter substrate-binding protein [Actinoplanes teichomyceticus]|uniref:Molybdate transport system substrate-binding protein n=1 Tax=Actinoplanes teichomyceticus TaxID=1867 RepID=A0A561VII5_ACTTI|nr:substrate-binding domain-containing protein [Actinoplanes teichomyceticus]TWG11422.1 molybdate transport system substrate-binding protein [Actinoplanes teichomyceticus]GIF15766.1 hypothetical protein Ate01nite_57980 [Actinoplanes teichomyceticus]